MKYHFLILFLLGHTLGGYLIIHGVRTESLVSVGFGILILFSPADMWPTWKSK